MVSLREYGKVLWNAVEERLRQLVEPRFDGRANGYSVEDILPLCRRQLEWQELSPRQLSEAAAQLPEDGEVQRQHIAEQANGIAERLAAERYVEHCVQIGQFLVCRCDTEREQIRNHFWQALWAWAYGDVEWGAHKRQQCGGVLGARLIEQFGLREAESLFALAQVELDKRVFAIEPFHACALAYQPSEGMKFENFLKRRICLRSGDVVRTLARAGHPREFLEMDVAALLPADLVVSEREHPQEDEAMYRKCLEAFRRAHKNADLAARKIAAFELRYKAYLDPQSQITRQTLRLVKGHRQQLNNEFLQCQEDLRKLEDNLSEAESAWRRAWETYQAARRTLDEEQCSEGELARLEREAMEADSAELGPADPQKRTPAMLRYKIAFKTLARARGIRENRWREWEQWEQCDKHWVREQKVIARFLGRKQPTVSKYIEKVVTSLQKCMGFSPPERIVE